MARTKTEADRKKEQDAEQGKGEVTDTSGIPVGEEIRNNEDAASPSVAGKDLNPQDEEKAQASDESSAETGTTTSSAQAAGARGQTAGESGAKRVDRGMVTAAGQMPEFVPTITAREEGRPGYDYPDPELLERERQVRENPGVETMISEFEERQRQEALQQEARRQAQQPNPVTYQTEVEQRQAALRKKAELASM